MSAPQEERLAEENRRLRQENEALQLRSQVLQSQTETLRSQTEALRIQLQELESIRRNLEHSDQVEPVVKAMAAYILSESLIQSDETSVRMQLADGQMETARLWAYGLPWAEVVFDFRTDKS